MPLIKSQFQSSRFLKNGHLQTMYPYFFRKVNDVEYSRIRINLKDGDFIDVDYTDIHSDELIILSHGLEGSTSTGYIKGMTKYFSENQNKDVLAWNMRSCSGELNKKESFYHAGQISDLHEVIEFALNNKKYKKISLIGFSLGGCLTANYLADAGFQTPSEIHSAVLFSTPLCLYSSILKLQKTKIGKIYANSFLKTMKNKVKQKHKQITLPQVNLKAVKKTKCFIEFDNLVTAPLAGFENANHYYTEASAIKNLNKISIPTLIVQAQNDPFLGEESYPVELAKSHKFIHLEITPSGGHVGFMNYNKGLEYWSEHRAAEFIESF